MKDPWTCSECGGEMIKGLAHSNYIACPRGHGKLHLAPHVEDLPEASRAWRRMGVVYPWTRLYWIEGKDGLWKYIPRAHETALNKRPGPGVVVARVLFESGKVEVRAFRRTGKRPTGA